MLRNRVSTRRRLILEALEDRLCLSSLPLGTSTTSPDAATRARLRAAYGQVPLSFEANRGQTDSRVDFLSRGSGYAMFLTPNKAVLSLKQGDTSKVVSMRIVGANPASRAVGHAKQAGVSNYFIGNDPLKWHTNITNYAKVGYRSVYRGIDLDYHGDQKQLEYDFVVEPGADARAIRLKFDGIQSKSLDTAGNLDLHTSGGEMVEHAPVAYQTILGVRHPVAAHFALGRAGQVGFRVGRYDQSRPLVIDPVLSYSTYLGGGKDDASYAIAVDGAGNAYVTGFTHSTNFATKTPFQGVYGGVQDAFITKFKVDGTKLVYSTYLGGSGIESGEDIAVDAAGNAYVVGLTSSTDFPTSHAAQHSHGGGNWDDFVTALNSTGSGLRYSTYLGGSGSENTGGGQSSVSIALSTDGSGNTSAYVAGSTESTNFPTTSGAYQVANNGIAASVTKYGPAGAIVYSTCLGGTTGVYASDIAVDGSGNAYLTGHSNSGVPTTKGAYQTTPVGNEDAFVTKFNPTGGSLVYSTYLGGSGADYASGIAVDSSGNAYVTGSTQSTNFPTKSGAYQAAFGGGTYDGFVTKLNATGIDLLYSTYLGGSDLDEGFAIAVDGSGNAYVTGYTQSPNFPIKSAFQPTLVGPSDAFVAKLNPSLSGTASLVYSSYLGGSLSDWGVGIAVDASGNAFVAGYTISTDFPTKNPLQDHKKGGADSYDVFVTMITGN